MLAAFETQYHPRRRLSPVVRVMRWALVASLAIVLLIAGLSPAIAASVPGEPLYTAKQVYESIELLAATSPVARASVNLQHANQRLHEALTLLDRGNFDPLLIQAALSHIADADATAVQASPRLQAEVLQAQATMGFVLRDAEQLGLTSKQQIAPLAQQVEELGRSDLLVPPPSSDGGTTAEATRSEEPKASPEPTPEMVTPTEVDAITPLPPMLAATVDTTESAAEQVVPADTSATPTCLNGKSCQSRGVPGGQVQTPTPKPTHVPQGSASGENGNSGGNGNDGNNGNAGGNSNGGNGNDGNNGNAGGNGNGGNAGNGNAGGNSNSGGNSSGGNSDSGNNGKDKGNNDNSGNKGKSGND